MPISRRTLFAALPLVAVSFLAEADTTDLSLACDTAAAPAIQRAADLFRARTGVRVFVHATTPGLLLPQLERTIQNDIIVTTPARLDLAEQKGIVQPGGRTLAWRNRLVIATAPSLAAPPGTLAAPDPTPGSDIDGPAILRILGLTATVGVIDTAAVAWLLKEANVRQGLLHQTEVAADARLRTATPVPDDAAPPVLYAATVSRLASRPNPQDFVSFLTMTDGLAVLRAAGLERVA